MMLLRRKATAFTLVELLVAVGITAVLAALLLSIVANTLGIWHRSAGALAMENRAQLVLDRIAVDLESAFVRRDNRTWLRHVAPADDTTELRLFAALAATSGDATDPNALREIGYELVADGNGVGRLYRGEGAAAAALQSGYVFAVEPVDAEFLLAEAVAGLRCEFFTADGTGISQPDPADWPVRCHVTLELISDDGVVRLAAVAAGNSTETVETIFAATTRRYARDIELMARAL